MDDSPVNPLPLNSLIKKFSIWSSKWWAVIKYFILFAATQSLVALGDYNFLYGIDRSDGAFEKRIDTSGKITMVILSFDLYFQTKKYNRNLYKTIFKNN